MTPNLRERLREMVERWRQRAHALRYNPGAMPYSANRIDDCASELLAALPAEPETPSLCPKCNGQGHVWMPPDLPGDQQEWAASTITSYPCRVCGGKGVLSTHRAEPETLTDSQVHRDLWIQAFDHPPTAECPDQECMVCGVRDCPEREPLHYHHDGCPCCSKRAEPETPLLMCSKCHRYTTRLEADLRKFNTGRCADCGSGLMPCFAHQPREATDAPGATRFPEQLWAILKPQLARPSDPEVAYALLEALAQFYAVYGMQDHPSIPQLSAKMAERIEAIRKEHATRPPA